MEEAVDLKSIKCGFESRSDILRDAVEFAMQCLDDKVIVIYRSTPQMEHK